jgi:hypothetical protein
MVNPRPIPHPPTPSQFWEGEWSEKLRFDGVFDPIEPQFFGKPAIGLARTDPIKDPRLCFHGRKEKREDDFCG